MSSSSPFPQLPVWDFYPSPSPQPPPSPRVREDPPGLPRLWGGSAVSVLLQDFVIAFYSSHTALLSKRQALEKSLPWRS